MTKTEKRALCAEFRRRCDSANAARGKFFGEAIKFATQMKGYGKLFVVSIVHERHCPKRGTVQPLFLHNR